MHEIQIWRNNFNLDSVTLAPCMKRTQALRLERPDSDASSGAYQLLDLDELTSDPQSFTFTLPHSEGEVCEHCKINFWKALCRSQNYYSDVRYQY